MFAGRMLTEEEHLEAIGRGLTDVTMHEVGHTLGLRHNFRGSVELPYAKRLDLSYIRKHGLSSSVMDYLPMNYMSKSLFETREEKDSSQFDYLFSPTIGKYDIDAIRYGYSSVR
mmetsp:Transcript_15131/g.18346  ORF Transcript_15131/g.18346 Transcript_15131/m.18346 type:complete len:114 (-) Transcript_15131:2592-2933(-)